MKVLLTKSQILAFVTPYIDTGAGLLVSWLFLHFRFLGTLGISQGQSTKAIEAVCVFAVTAGISWASHHFHWLPAAKAALASQLLEVPKGTVGVLSSMIAKGQPLIDFQDAVNANVLDPNAKYAVYYADGAFRNEAAVRARCPRAKLFGITVFGLTGPSIFACDCETGDMTVAQAVAWVEEQVRLGVGLIVVYANLNRWENEGLRSALEKYGHRIKRWVALYNDVPEIQPWADAEQFSSGNVDRDVALASFFEIPARRASAEIQVDVGPDAKGILRAMVEFDAQRKTWNVLSKPGDHVDLDGGSGAWRAKGIAWNSPPLGG